MLTFTVPFLYCINVNCHATLTRLNDAERSTIDHLLNILVMLSSAPTKASWHECCVFGSAFRDDHEHPLADADSLRSEFLVRLHVDDGDTLRSHLSLSTLPPSFAVAQEVVLSHAEHMKNNIEYHEAFPEERESRRG